MMKIKVMSAGRRCSRLKSAAHSLVSLAPSTGNHDVPAENVVELVPGKQSVGEMEMEKK